MPFISVIFHMHTDRIPDRYLGLLSIVIKVRSILLTPGPWLVLYFRSGKNPHEPNPQNLTLNDAGFLVT